MDVIDSRIRAMQSSLGNAEKNVASYFLANKNNVFAMPLAQLAEASGTSQVAWVRFCKSIGFSGLRELKRALFEELQQSVDTPEAEAPAYTDVSGNATVQQMIDNVRTSSIQAIDDTLRMLPEQAVEQAAEKILSATSIKLFGMGASALVAQDFYEKLIRIGKNVAFCGDFHVQLSYAANLGSEDVAIFISNTGATREVVECLERAKANNCTTIAVTSYGKSPLCTSADFVLNTTSAEISRRSGAFSSRLSQLALLDVLFTAIAKLDYENIEAKLEKSYQSYKKHMNSR